MENIRDRMLHKERFYLTNLKNHFRLQKIYDKYISKSKKHLDFGCEFGFFTYILACSYQNTDVTGTDMEKEAIAKGKERYVAPNLTLMVSSKINGKFDTISCFNTLHEIAGDRNIYLKEFYSHLNSNGKIIIYDFRKVSKKKFMKYYKKKLKNFSKTKHKIKRSFEEDYEHSCKWSVKQFVSMFEKMGFKTLEIKPFETSLIYVGEKK
jgi:ubiquinone/menaquinone biosynthesis C-methylase UbiE